MPTKKLTEVFYKAELSEEITGTLKNASVIHVTVSEKDRIMWIHLSIPDGVKEEILHALKQELLAQFYTLSDIRLEIDGPIIPTEKETPQNFKSYRKIKVNKIIEADRRLLSEELNAGEDICIEGISFNLDSRVLKTGRTLITFDLHGRETEDLLCAISVKLFSSLNTELPVKNGKAVTVRGKVSYDEYAGELIILADTIAPGQPIQIKQDNAPEKRVELHLHTNMSSLDAVTSAGAYIKRAAFWGHPAIAITDHGVAQAFPEAANAARGTGVKILYGMEAYLINDLKNDPKAKEPDAYKKLHYSHATIFATNKTGLKNLYILISLSHTQYFYRRPRLPFSVLLEHREGLIVGSACEASRLFRAVRKGKSKDKLKEIAAFYDFLEIQPLGNNAYMLRNGMASSVEDLKNFNRTIVALGEELNKPVVATCDTHFLDPSDEVFRRIIQGGDGFEEADMQAPLYYRTTEEMLAEFDYLGEEKAYEVVVTNPRAIADSIEELVPIPREAYPPVVPNAEEDIKKMTYTRAYATYGDPLPDLVADRLKQELDSIIQNGFAGMYITSQKLVAESEANGYMVGSRGSVGSSLVATMTGITEVNPLPPHYFCADPKCRYFDCDPAYSGSGFDLPNKLCPNCGESLKKDGHDIPFETFLGFDGDKEPDIDLNFSGEYQQQAHLHAESLFGKGQVFKSGTIATIADKTAYGYVKKYFEAKNQVKRKAEINRLVAGCTGIKRTTGQHPGGLIVVPAGHSIYEFCPVQHPANQSKSGVTTTHFDYHSIEGCLFKLDILGHDVPTILRMLHDFTGIDPRSVPLDDKNVLSFFNSSESIGLPEFGTYFVRQMLKETLPSSFSDLVRISGLSHGTNVWTNNGQDLIREKKATLKENIPTRDDIMVYLIRMGVEKKTAFKIMESVRKGRGLTDDDAAKMLKANVPKWYVESCRKISFLFPKAHAVAYVLMTVRIAYFKKYHPKAFYAASFSVKADDFDYALMCVDESTAKTEYIRLKESDDKKALDSAKDKNTIAILELVLEMYRQGISFTPLDVYASEASRFKPTEAGILPPLCTVSGLGQSVADAIAEARQDGPFETIEDFKERTKVNKTVLGLLREYGVLSGIPETNQLSLFD